MDKISLIDACDKALGIVSRDRDMEQLHRRAIRSLGEGRLRSDVMNLASEAICDESLCREVFASAENMLSFFCGVWVRFLLVEVAGLKKEKLGDLARKAFGESIGNEPLH